MDARMGFFPCGAFQGYSYRLSYPVTQGMKVSLKKLESLGYPNPTVKCA